jgi:propanediol dehydratase small subunit
MNSAIQADQLLRELALAIARNQVGAQRPTHEVIAGECVTQAEYDLISKNPQFQRYVDAYCNELRDSGFSFAAKAKILAEDLLVTSYHMARDPDVPAAVRAKIHENFVEWADLKPKKDQNVLAGTGFSITINIPSTLEKPAETIVLETNFTEIEQKTVENAQTAPILSFSEDEEYEYAGEDYYE